MTYPGEAPETLTVISLSVVFFNSLSGMLAYLRSAIDFKAGLIFGLATMPGAVVGALTTVSISRAHFNLAFGILLIAVAAFLALKFEQKHCCGDGAIRTRRQPTAKFSEDRDWRRCQHDFRFHLKLLGDRRWVLLVPALVYLLNFPVHVATATSLLVLNPHPASLSPAAPLTSPPDFFAHGFRRAIALSIGAIVGAQVAALLSQRIRGDWIIRSLAVALVLVGLRLVTLALSSAERCRHCDHRRLCSPYCCFCRMPAQL